MTRMRWLGIGLMVLLLAALSVSATFTPGAQGNPDKGPPERFLVFTSGDPEVHRTVRDAVDRAGGRTLDEVRVQADLHFLVVSTPAKAARDLAGVPGVREVSPDLPPTIPGHDPNTSERLDWGGDRIEADKVWSDSPADGIGASRSVNIAPDATVTGNGVTVAVTDSGVQLDHPDLYPNTLGPLHANCSGDGQCTTADGATTPGSPGYDNNGDGHGTGVAGIVAAVDNSIGTIGVSPRATVLSANCFEPATFFSCLRAVRYAGGLDQNGYVVSTPRARAVNMSWGWDKRLEKQCPSCVTTINAIMEEAWSRGLVLLAAAGNGGSCRGSGDNVIFPARLDKPIAVAATTRTDVRPCFSATGSSLDVTAPGASIESPWYGGYTTWSGTSASTPHASGVAALILSKNGGLTNTQVRSVLENNTQDLGPSGTDSQYGKGLVRADLAVANTP